MYALDFNRTSMGAHFNYYFGGAIAPVGNSIGVFYLIDNYKVQDYNEFHAYLQRKLIDNFVTEEEIKYQNHFIGVDLNFVKLLSKKVPVYLKYGAGLAFPVFSQIKDLTVNAEGFETYNSLSITYEDYDFLADFVTKRSLSINIGIGIMIR